ncbi:MAG: type II secretion system protein [Sedimentisphaerales bacterium]|nr:type II secretion system protein [Sedimentisphaerales bacterium]
MRRRCAQFGFSLVEVLVVMAIIIILATIVVGVGRRFVRQSQERLTDSGINVIQAAIEQYHDFHEKFPFVTPPLSDPDGYTQAMLAADLDGVISAGIFNEYASSERLYYELDQYPNSRRLIETMVSEMKTSKDSQGRDRKIVLNNGSEEKPLVRFVDVWGRSLRYVYTQDMTFPLVVSDGVDGEPGTADDLTGEQ